MRLLVIEDDPDLAFAIRRAVHDLVDEVTSAATAAAGLARVAESKWDAVILDLGLPDMPGLDVLARILAGHRNLPVFVLTGLDQASTAAKAFRLGARDYLVKPLERDVLRSRISSVRRIRDQAQVTVGGELLLLGRAPAWLDAVALVESAAVARSPVLLLGESGTGKEVLARHLHVSSDRALQPFVTLNAACLSASLLESELFGHEAGAFTGAVGKRRGLLELAEGGTLFLDEIGELPLELQPKLLRLLEGQSYRRVGGEHERTADVRFVAATNRDLAEEVRARRFRADLYFRLRVIEVTIPPLRDRRGDVDLLAAHFALRRTAGRALSEIIVEDEAMSLLRVHPWPGNVRELRNVIDAALLAGDGKTIRATDLRRLGATAPAAPEPAESPLASLESVVNAHVRRAFEASDHNLSRAARILGIGRTALRRRLRAMGIPSL